MTTHRRISLAVLTISLLCAPMPLLAKEASVGKASKLYAEPFKDAAIITSLKPTSTVEVMERKGGWSRIQYQQSKGWIRTLDLRFGKDGESSVVADTFGLATGRSGSGNVVATTGIRGLDEEDLKSADFSAEQIAQAESYRSDAEMAQSTAARAGLQAADIAYFESSDNRSTSTRRRDR